MNSEDYKYTSHHLVMIAVGKWMNFRPSANGVNSDHFIHNNILPEGYYSEQQTLNMGQFLNLISLSASLNNFLPYAPLLYLLISILYENFEINSQV
jgi:hypothetical protein